METTNFTVADIVSTKEFHENLVQIINPVIKFRRGLTIAFKRDAIDRLIEKGVLLDSERFTVVYIQVLTKSCDTTEYPKALRDCVKHFGDRALHKTINQFKEDEKNT